MKTPDFYKYKKMFMCFCVGGWNAQISFCQRLDKKNNNTKQSIHIYHLQINK